jgi:hypothetical protein
MVRFSPLKISTGPNDLDKPEVVINDIKSFLADLITGYPKHFTS